MWGAFRWGKLYEHRLCLSRRGSRRTQLRPSHSHSIPSGRSRSSSTPRGRRKMARRTMSARLPKRRTDICGSGRPPAAVSRLQNGPLASSSEQDGLPATSALVESDDGTLIAATANGLSRLERGRWKDATKEWNFPGKQARQLYFDKDGTLWVASENNVMYLRRGQGRFIDTGVALQVFYDFVKGPEGESWFSEVERSAHTIGRAGDGTRDTEVRVGATWVLFDRDGSLWVASLGDGLRRVPYA